jgi:hypothetical protein
MTRFTQKIFAVSKEENFCTRYRDDYDCRHQLAERNLLARNQNGAPVCMSIAALKLAAPHQALWTSASRRSIQVGNSSFREACAPHFRIQPRQNYYLLLKKDWESDFNSLP